MCIPNAVKSESINMARAREQRNILDRNRNHDLPNTGRTLYPTELRELMESQVI